MEKTLFPFSALVGQDLMKRALLLNVVDPSIGGVLIKGERGTAKSTGVRALVDLLPGIKVVEGCPFQCDPEDYDSLCVFCKERWEKEQRLPEKVRPIHLVNLPIGITEDRLIGTINIEEALKKGRKAFEPGLLAEANRGILYVDEVNLLNDQIVDLLLDVAASGINLVEREGVSFTHASRFVLVGTMNPEEGDLRPQLLDRFGLCVSVKGVSSLEERMEIIRRRLLFEQDPVVFKKVWSREDEKLRDRVEKARDHLKDVVVKEDMLTLAARIAMAMDTDGHRAEITIIKAARANAALEGRYHIEPDDIYVAAKLSLGHRIKKNPLEKKELDEEKLRKILGDATPQEENVEEQWAPVYQNPQKSNKEDMDKKCFSPLGCVTHLCTGEQVSVKPRFPFQKLVYGNHPGRRFPVPGDCRSGCVTGIKLPPKQGRAEDISILGTLRAAAPYQSCRSRNGSIVVEPQDIRLKKRLKRTGLTVMLVIDSSASMRTNDRMSITKGIIDALLKDLYLKRDRIGIVSFRHNMAEIVLPITSNMHDASSRIQNLPVGGRTPLALGMDLSLRLLRQEQLKNPEVVPLVILFSDGRPNVSSFGGDPLDEALTYAMEMRRRNIQSLFIDTELNPMAMGYGYVIAQRMNALYLPMDRLFEN